MLSPSAQQQKKNPPSILLQRVFRMKIDSRPFKINNNTTNEKRYAKSRKVHKIAAAAKINGHQKEIVKAGMPSSSSTSQQTDILLIGQQNQFEEMLFTGWLLALLRQNRILNYDDVYSHWA